MVRPACNELRLLSAEYFWSDKDKNALSAYLG